MPEMAKRSLQALSGAYDADVHLLPMGHHLLFKAGFVKANVAVVVDAKDSS